MMKIIEEFKTHIMEDGKSTNTIQSYLEDVTAFIKYIGTMNVEFDATLKRFYITSYRNYLIFFNKKENGNLDFRKTTKEIMLLTIIKEYEFLWNYKEVNGNKEKMPLDIFLNGTISEKEENQVLYIKKKREKSHFCITFISLKMDWHINMMLLMKKFVR